MASFIPRLGLNGIGGIGQMTAGARGVLQKARGAMGGGGKRRKKKAAAKSAGGGKRKRKKKSSGGGMLKKGSAAAKAYMAKIRKMRK